jgi:GNAT superfamily N-acetyltransferase
VITVNTDAATGIGVTIRVATPAEVLNRIPQLCHVYKTTFSEPPYFETLGHARRFVNRLPQHTYAAGFRCALAWADDELVGFAFGMTADPLLDPPFYAALIDSVGLWTATHWVLGQFELAEFAVLPDRQGCGIGGLLHDAVLGMATHHLAWLLAHPLAPARGFYRARGWRELGFYDTGRRVLVVMGRPLTAVASPLPAPT